MYLFASWIKNYAQGFIDFRGISILLALAFYALINEQFAQPVRGKAC